MRPSKTRSVNPNRHVTDWDGIPHRDNVLRSQGYATYAAYLRSPHWQEVRRRWSRECDLEGCDNKGELHHWTYRRLGREERKDLISLCRKHHGAAHEIMWETGCGLRAATQAVAGTVKTFGYKQSWLPGREPKQLRDIASR